MRLNALVPEFVETIPKSLEPGRIYISVRYRTASHLCPCGCGSTVVTPITPAKWHLTYDGEAVSLWPSIGNWQKPCQSHYWIRENKVVWAAPWSKKKIEAGRRRDERDLREHYDRRPKGLEREIASEESATSNSRLHRVRDHFKRYL
jgi:hypothetical protein